MSELSLGDVVTGVVEQIMPYGAFVKLQNGQKAMIHISQLSHRFTKSVDSVLQLQQQVKAKIIKIDERGRIDLSIKALEEPPVPQMPRTRPFPSASHASFSRGTFPKRDMRDGKDANPEADDFEKKLSSFMKTTEEKLSSMMSTKSGTGHAPRRKGARP